MKKGCVVRPKPTIESYYLITKNSSTDQRNKLKKDKSCYQLIRSGLSVAMVKVVEEVATITIGEVILPKNEEEVVVHSKIMIKARSNAITAKNTVTILPSARNQ